MSEAIESALVKVCELYRLHRKSNIVILPHLYDPLRQVPFDSLKRTTRERKYAIDELKETLRHVKATTLRPASPEVAVHDLQECLRQVQRVKRKLDSVSSAERDEAERCSARLEHLQQLGRPMREEQINWNRRRIDRILVDYMLRRGYVRTAEQLVQKDGIADLTDIHVFQGAQRMLAALDAHSCSEALKWCQAQAARLGKSNSPLEFQLRLQEFIELMRMRDQRGAITYARRHLTSWARQYPRDLQRAAALLAFGADTTCEPYASLLSEKRWNELISLFKFELFRLHSLPVRSVLEVHLQAGLSALKTLESGTGARSGRQDPLNLPTYHRLAQGLPFAKHVHSKLVCALTGEVMSEHNPPMALPNGYVYSKSALEKMAAADNGTVTCPVTQDKFLLDSLRRVFIM